MKKNQVEIGKVYAVKVSGVVVPVQITSESPYGGWMGRNMKTNRAVRIKTAGRLRYEVTQSSFLSTEAETSFPHDGDRVKFTVNSIGLLHPQHGNKFMSDTVGEGDTGTVRGIVNSDGWFMVQPDKYPTLLAPVTVAFVEELK